MSYIVSIYTNLEIKADGYHRVLICETDLPISDLADGLYPEEFDDLVQETITLMGMSGHSEATIRNTNMPNSRAQTRDDGLGHPAGHLNTLR